MCRFLFRREIRLEDLENDELRYLNQKNHILQSDDYSSDLCMLVSALWGVFKNAESTS